MKHMSLRAAEIRKLASDPERGVPSAEVFGPVWTQHHHSTKEAIWRMSLHPAPWGSAKYGEPLLFLREVARAMAPASKGKTLAARFNAVVGEGFRRGLGNLQALWQWFPGHYHDDNGVPNCLVVTADGFPTVRLRLGVDMKWRLGLAHNPEVYRRIYENGSALPWSKADERVKTPRLCYDRIQPALFEALGVEPGTDPLTLQGRVVTEDEILRIFEVYDAAL